MRASRWVGAIGTDHRRDLARRPGTENCCRDPAGATGLAGDEAANGAGSSTGTPASAARERTYRGVTRRRRYCAMSTRRRGALHGITRPACWRSGHHATRARAPTCQFEEDATVGSARASGGPHVEGGRVQGHGGIRQFDHAAFTTGAAINMDGASPVVILTVASPVPAAARSATVSLRPRGREGCRAGAASMSHYNTSRDRTAFWEPAAGCFPQPTLPSSAPRGGEGELMQAAAQTGARRICIAIIPLHARLRGARRSAI